MILVSMGYSDCWEALILYIFGRNVMLFLPFFDFVTPWLPYDVLESANKMLYNYSTPAFSGSCVVENLS